MTPAALDATFSALADPTRRAILARLARGEASVMELAQPFAMSQPAISKHLKVLERAGLIARGRDAQRRPCRLVGAPLQEVSAYAEGYRAFWESSFDALDGVLEDLKRQEPGGAATTTRGAGAATTTRAAGATHRAQRAARHRDHRDPRRHDHQGSRQAARRHRQEIPASAGEAMSKLKLLTGAPNEIVMEREFDAPRHLVIKAMSTPELVKRWLGGVRATVTSVTIDWRVGGRYRYEFLIHGGGTFSFSGVIQELGEDRVVQTEVFDDQPGESIVTTTYVEHGGKTTMRLVCSYPTVEIRDMVAGTGMAEGAGESYDELEKLLASLCARAVRRRPAIAAAPAPARRPRRQAPAAPRSTWVLMWTSRCGNGISILLTRSAAQIAKFSSLRSSRGRSR